MKIIHTADLHLGSPLSRLGKNARTRQNELLLDFLSLLEYAKANNIDALLICGDMFDSAFVNPRLYSSVRAALENAAPLQIYILGGNHDSTSSHTHTNAYSQSPSAPASLALSDFPKNVFVAQGGEWNYFSPQNGVKICMLDAQGAVIDERSRLKIDSNNFNIIMLHGEISAAGSPQYALNVAPLAKFPIDYAALGHRHSYYEMPFARGNLVYCGCLSVRGFDEPDAPGFVEIDTASGEFERKLFNGRRVCDVRVLINKNMSDAEILDAAKSAAKGQNASDFINIIIDGEGEVDLELLSTAFDDAFFALRIENRAKLPYDFEKLTAERSLRGYFLKHVFNSQLAADEKLRVAALGLAAMEGKALKP